MAKSYTEKYKFKNFIKKNTHAKRRLKTLSITHVTEFYNIRDIFDCEGLNPTPCKVFNEDLLYFFYGRPAYRYGKDGVNCSQKAYHPLCLVFELKDLECIDRVYPFDSGGFNYYKDFINTRSPLDYFELERSIEGINDLISFFYKSSSDYYDCCPKPIDSSSFELAFELESYYGMITQGGITADDERNSAIEIQTKNKVALKKLKAIIFPQQKESIIREILKELGVTKCKIEPYYLTGITNPNDYFGEIKRIIRGL